MSRAIDIKKTKIDTNTNFIKDLMKQIETISNSDNLLNSNIKSLENVQAELRQCEDERKVLLEERKYIETAITLLKDGGIKTKIIKQYIPVINKMINKYLQDMGFFVNFNINENFEETIKSRHRDTFSYENFSEGEKTRIDLAVLFTWRAIAKMRNSVNCNILFFDEIFDSSLDTNGTDEFMKIILSLTNDTNTFIISHKDQLVDKFQKVYKFQKIRGFSVLGN
jgi:DNA repair exonuclease SbcCD ATPase subunit